MSATLATGAPLTAETFADFVERLRHHCRGEGVEWHSTAYALFTVQQRVFVYGIDTEYTDKLAIITPDKAYRTMDEFIESVDEDIAELDRRAMNRHDKSFAELDLDDKYDLIEGLPDHSVTGWDEHWEHVGTHFTKEAAEAFMTRKSHDYRDGLRVYVEAQPYAWEFEAIKNALMDGRIVLAQPDQCADLERLRKLEAGMTVALQSCAALLPHAKAAFNRLRCIQPDDPEGDHYARHYFHLEQTCTRAINEVNEALKEQA